MLKLGIAERQRLSWITRFHSALGRFARLREGWDSFDARPLADVALIHAHRFLESLWALGVRPSRIAPTVDRSILISFFGVAGVRASIEILTTGEILASVVSSNGQIDVWKVPYDASEEVARSAAKILAATAARSPSSDVSVG